MSEHRSSALEMVVLSQQNSVKFDLKLDTSDDPDLDFGDSLSTVSNLKVSMLVVNIFLKQSKQNRFADYFFRFIPV